MSKAENVSLITTKVFISLASVLMTREATLWVQDYEVKQLDKDQINTLPTDGSTSAA